MEFRSWLRLKWNEHQAELEFFGQRLDYDLQHYFNKYKWWLKREYRHQLKSPDIT
jgi:hypothetical protein